TLLPAALGAQLRAGVTKSRDTVTVGEPFEVRVRVRAPAEAAIRFPENPDSTGTVQARDPRTIVTTDSIQSLDQTAVYRVAAWDVGRQPIRLGDVIVTLETPAREDRRVSVGAIDVFVRSVLPADSSLRVPKPARPLWETKAFPWWILALIAAAIALGVLVWWWLRRRRRPRPVVVVDPYVRALKEFTRLETMGLVDAGERTRFVALAVEVLRDYLLAKYTDASLALTSPELIGIMRRHPYVPVEQLSRVLHEADLAKFARWSLTEDRARQLEREARAIVEQEHKASQPRPPLHEAA
ncbi:MAG: hypothetical protein ACRENU_06360, partial [Gemmatimonadaceae bacterium]